MDPLDSLTTSQSIGQREDSQLPRHLPFLHFHVLLQSNCPTCHIHITRMHLTRPFARSRISEKDTAAANHMLTRKQRWRRVKGGRSLDMFAPPLPASGVSTGFNCQGPSPKPEGQPSPIFASVKPARNRWVSFCFVYSFARVPDN